MCLRLLRYEPAPHSGRVHRCGAKRPPLQLHQPTQATILSRFRRRPSHRIRVLDKRGKEANGGPLPSLDLHVLELVHVCSLAKEGRPHRPCTTAVTSGEGDGGGHQSYASGASPLLSNTAPSYSGFSRYFSYCDSEQSSRRVDCRAEAASRHPRVSPMMVVEEAWRSTCVCVCRRRRRHHPVESQQSETAEEEQSVEED